MMSTHAKIPEEDLGSTSLSQSHNSSDESPKAGLGELSLGTPTTAAELAPLTHNKAPKRKRAETRSDAVEGTRPVLTEPYNKGTINRVQDINASNHSRVHVGNNHYYNAPKIDEECLRHLHIINPETHKKEIENTKGGLLKASYDWILNHNDFKAFQSNPERRLLWIKGDPGKGKTMLLCGIIDELSKEPSQLTSFYFCQATNTELRKATSVVRGLIWLLCKKKPELISCVRAKYDIEGEKIFEGFCALESLKEILTHIIAQPAAQNAILIVDALDECADDDRRDLIGLILKLSSTSRSKWIVSSRNWPTIEEQFLLTPNVSIILELNKDATTEAVKMYIQKKVDELSQMKRYDAKTKQAVFDTLLVKSENTFLWVGLACRELSEVKLRHTMAKLDSVPRGLTQLYERMLERIWASDDCEICREVLATVCIAYRPVAVDELCVLAPDVKGFGTEELEEIVKECGSFLSMENDVIYFVHQTAKDFLMCKTEQVFRSGITHHHRTLFQRSMEALAGLNRNMYDLKHLGILLKEVTRPNPDPLSHLRYSTLYWIDHLEQVEQRKLSDEEAVDRFIRKKFLTWLEVMSLQSKMSEAGAALVKLREIMRNTVVRGLEDLVEDGQRFALIHRPGIEIAPLQVYASALVFSPTNSLIRKLFEEDELDWIAMKPQVNKDWDPWIQSLECLCTDTVISMTISADSKRLAAITSSGVEVWNLSPGKCVGSLKYGLLLREDSVTSIALSRDGRRLVVALIEPKEQGEETEIRIWDVASEAFVHAIQAHKGRINDAVFSPDGTLLATCSHDATIKIWDSDVTRCIRTLYGRDGRVNSLSFSANGRQLASFSFDVTVRVWDVATGKRKRTLWSPHRRESLIQSARLVAFLDADILASASNHQIKIWDTATGICIQTIGSERPSFEHGVRSIVARGNDRSLVSTTYDGKIRVWDRNGACIQILQARSDGETAVAALSNGDLIASGSGGDITKYWGVAKTQTAQSVENREYNFYRVKLSPDGRWLMSDRGAWDVSEPRYDKDSHDWEVNVWDASNGTHVFKTKNYLCILGLLPIFTPDSRWFVCLGEYRTLVVWDMAKLKVALVLQMTMMLTAFSSNGQLLAVHFENGTIEIWEIETQTRVQTFQTSIKIMEFSGDNNRLACATDSKVEIWDISTGALIQTFEHQNHLGQTLQKSKIAAGYRDPTTISMNANLLAALLDENTIDVWDIGPGTLIKSIRMPTSYHYCFSSIALSPNGKWIVCSTFNGLQVWNVNTGAQTLYVEIPAAIMWFRFGVESSNLHTPFRIIDLDELPTPRAGKKDTFQTLEYGGYRREKDWILRGDERILWLPSDFRTPDGRLWVKESDEIEVMGSTIAISTGGTRHPFWLMRFK